FSSHEWPIVNDNGLGKIADTYLVTIGPSYFEEISTFNTDRFAEEAINNATRAGVDLNTLVMTVAKFYAGGLHGGPFSSSTPWAIGSLGEVNLVWYEPRNVHSLRRFGSLSIRRRPRCFHGSSVTTTLLQQFGDQLYARLYLQTPSSARSHRNIIVCDTELGIIVGIKGNVRKHWNYTEYGILLERQQSVDMAAVSATSGATESTEDHIHTILFDEAEDRILRDGGRERVQAVSLPAETYTAIEVHGSIVSPPFPNLTDFKMLIRMNGDGPVASFTARGLDSASPDGQWSISSLEVDLVWYGVDSVRLLQKCGLMEVGWPPRCLYPRHKLAVNHFVKILTVFLSKGRPPLGKLSTQLIICVRDNGFIVGMGKNGATHWKSSDYGFLLSPNPMAPPSWHDQRGVVEPSKGAIPMSRRKRRAPPTTPSSKRLKKDERPSARSLKENPTGVGMSNIARPEQVSRSPGGFSILPIKPSDVARSPLPQVGAMTVGVHENNDMGVVHEVIAKETGDDHGDDSSLESSDKEYSSSYEDWLESLFDPPGAVFASFPDQVMDLAPGFDAHHRESGERRSTSGLDEPQLPGVFGIEAHQTTGPSGPSVDSRPPAANSPVPLDPTGVAERYPYEGNNRSSLSTGIHDGAYETDVTGLDSVKEVAMHVETEPDTDRRWVKLVFKLCNYEEPLYFHDAMAVPDDDDGCLQLDLSGDVHSLDIPILQACIRAQSIPPTSFRICGTAGGSDCYLKFNRIDPIGQAGNLTISTVKIQLHRVSYS
ncbi:hypothetical protein FOZ62_021173, partial [Perkinsus olseni]